MKNIFIVLVLLLISTTSFASSLKRANAEDVNMLLSAASGQNSAYWASYIGETRGRLYIQYETAVHTGSLVSKKLKHVVYWLPVGELSNEQLELFIKYKRKYESKSD